MLRFFQKCLLPTLLIGPFLFLFVGANAQTGISITSQPSVAESEITETDAVVRWQTSAEGTTVVRFGTTTAMDQSFRKIVPLEETEVFEVNHSMTLWQLEPGTVYYYTVRSVTESGLSVESGQSTFRTKSAEPRCTEDVWNCTAAWSACSADGKQTRTCTMKTDCPGVETPKPAEEQLCVPPCTADMWKCSDWGVCGKDGRQSRICTLKNECTTSNVPKPTEAQSCKPPAPPAPESAPKNSETELKETELRPAPVAEAPTQETPRIETEIRPLDLVAVSPVKNGETTPVPQPIPTEIVSLELRSAMQNFQQTAFGTEQQPGVPVEIRQMFIGMSGEEKRDVSDECAQNGINADRCAAWLSAKYGDRSCADAGLTTREACGAFLTGKNQGTFPGCEGKTAEECEQVKIFAMVGYLPADVRAKADQVIETGLTDKVVVELPGLMAVKKEALEGVGWWRSPVATGAETSPGVLIFDRDKDGLLDDFERNHGMNPDAADSDNDGVADMDEMRQGRNPAGDGTLAEKLSPVEATIVFRKPLEQPRGAGQTDPSFTLQLASATAQNKNSIQGHALPNTAIFLYVYSYIPMVLTTTTDANGNFSYDLGTNIVDGEHAVYVALTDDAGKITKKSSPLSFFVREASAATAEDFLRRDFDVASSPVETLQQYYIWGVGVVIVIGLAAALFVMRNQARTKRS